MLEDFDWSDQIVRERELGRDESCPAGLGLIQENDHLLHLMPRGGDRFDVYYRYQNSKKFMGFLRFHIQATEESFDLREGVVRRMIDAHYCGDHEKLLELLRGGG